MSIATAENELKSNSNTEYSYDKDFLSKEEADALLALAQSLPRDRPLNELSGFKNRLRRLQMPCYSATPNWRGSENEKTNQWMMALDEAPAEVKSLAEKLSKLAGKPVNYFSFVGYENEKDHIDWHQHREDKCRDARVFIISLGEVRTFGLRKLCDKCRVCDDCIKRMCAGETQPSCTKCKQAHKHRKTCKVCNDKSKWTLLQPAHGSLITLPDSYNNTHEHAVLDGKGPKGFRVSINTKHISTEDVAAGNGYIPKEHRHSGPTSKTEVVHCMKEPYDIYVGRRNIKAGLPESPFANRSGGDYEPYFREKLLRDPAFAGQVLKCHDKRLGCWCKGTSRNFSQCHGHVVARWADVIAAKWEELKPDKVAMRSWLNETIANEPLNKEVKLTAGRPKQTESGNGTVEVDTVTSSDDDFFKDVEPFVELPLTPRTVDSYFDEFELNGYAWKDRPNSGGWSAFVRKFRGADVRVAFSLDDESYNFSVIAPGQVPYRSKEYKDFSLCRAAAFVKVMLMTGANREEVTDWWNRKLKLPNDELAEKKPNE